MKPNNKPLKRSFLFSIVMFLVVLGLVLSITQHLRYRKLLYARYEHYIENVLRYTAAGIDTDDLAECIRTGEESEKFHALQGYLDGIRANMDLHFLYVIIPLNTEPADNIMNVIAAVSDYEYQYMADQLVHLRQLTGDSYSPATAKKYLDAYQSGTLSFFESVSEWGDDYTGLLPLYDSYGERVAALCMDIDIQEIHHDLRMSTAFTALLLVLLGTLFTAVFLSWADRNVIHPIELLERSAVDFASVCEAQTDPDALRMELPELHTGNELEILSASVRKMSEAMRDYLKNFVSTERELARMTALANNDALTHAQNKTAFDTCVDQLRHQIEEEPVPFAVLMLDLNNLKRTNDVFGHEHGDIYIKTCCRIISDTFAHSPVFRVGGDEFTVLLTGQDYDDREELLRQARVRFVSAAADRKLPPWERVSVAIGMAEFRPGVDTTVAEVINRADQQMYQEKRRMKSEM